MLTSDEKKEYISAVQCLLELPSKSDPAFAPGARNRMSPALSHTHSDFDPKRVA